MGLLMAFVLQPANEATHGGQEEAQTRLEFDVSLALRLCDYSWEAYDVLVPMAISISGFDQAVLNGKYNLQLADMVYVREEREETEEMEAGTEGEVARDEEELARDRMFRETAQGDRSDEKSCDSKVRSGSDRSDGQGIDRSSKDSGQDGTNRSRLAGLGKCRDSGSSGACSSSGVCLRRVSGDTPRWEIVTASNLMASVQSDACSPMDIEGLWEENGYGEKLVHIDQVGIPRRFEYHMREGSMPWVFVEEVGSLTAGTTCLDATDEGSDTNVVNFIMAFRGTDSLDNVATNVRAGLRALPTVTDDGVEAAEQGEFAPLETQLRICMEERLHRAVAPSIVDDNTSLSLGATGDEPLADAPETPHSPLQGQGGSMDSLTERLHRSPQPNTQQVGICRRCMQCFLRCCLSVLCPFSPADHEYDDHPFNTNTLRRMCVHRGFFSQYQLLRHDVMQKLRQRLQECRQDGKEARVFLTGHSLGGSVAYLFALDLASSGLDLEPTVYTFGSPRPGNAAFRSIYNMLVPRTFRIVASRDLVSTLPAFCYRQVGREVWLDDTGVATFAMSWAMRHILPPRDDLACHRLVEYYRRLNKAFSREHKQSFVTAFKTAEEVLEALRIPEVA